MSSTSTSRLGLFKAVSGSAEPFRTSDLNSNSDKIDADSVAVNGRLNVVELATTSGSVVNATNATSAVKATNIAGGALGRIPVQSGVDATVFVVAASAAGKLLSSQPTSPYAAWLDPYVFNMQAGVASTSAASVVVTFGSPFASGIVPIISATAVGTGTPTSITISAISNTGFTAFVWAGTVASPSSWAASSVARTFHWTAVQQASATGKSNPDATYV